MAFGSPPGRPFREAERDLLNILASNFGLKQLSLLQNRELEHLARMDTLSHLANRKGLHQRLSVEQNRLSRRGAGKRPQRFSVCFMDLDNFKYYNDTFGHQAGDFLIAKVAALITSIFRDVDFIARYGGDEFVVLLPDTDGKEAEIPAQRVLSELRERSGFRAELSKLLERPVNLPAGKILSCSIGIADLSVLPAGGKPNLEELIRLADKALYKAKAAGKGRIAHA